MANHQYKSFSLGFQIVQRSSVRKALVKGTEILGSSLDRIFFFWQKKMMEKGFEPKISLSCPGAFPTELRWTI